MIYNLIIVIMVRRSRNRRAGKIRLSWLGWGLMGKFVMAVRSATY
jgi:hypothetical protein